MSAVRLPRIPLTPNTKNGKDGDDKLSARPIINGAVIAPIRAIIEQLPMHEFRILVGNNSLEYR